MAASDPDPAGAPEAPWQPARIRPTGRAALAAAPLAALIVVWAALPVPTGRSWTKIALIAAIVTAALSVIRLAISGTPSGFRSVALMSGPARAVEWVRRTVRALPWAEGLIVAVLGLEALHPARPWHTGLLGLGLLAYLFAVHLAETDARLAVLRPQLPLLAAGIGLLALAVGAAALPALDGGPATPVKVIAIAALVLVAAIALPFPGAGTTHRDG
jgi:hypothetical protein